jgi:prevent-host-death family protein
MPIKVIARRVGCSKNTVRSVLSRDVSPKYERKPRGSLVDAVEPRTPEAEALGPTVDMYSLTAELYSRTMTIEMPVTEARERFSEIVETSAHEPVFLTKRGHRQAVVISTAEYERLLEADEDAQDLAASDTVMAEIMAGAPTIPWAQVKADLGLA